MAMVFTQDNAGLYCPVCEKGAELFQMADKTPVCPGCASVWWEDIYPQILEELLNEGA